MSEPFECPVCNCTEFRASYLEAVWQTVALTAGEDGEPEFVDYTGCTGSFSDGSTPDEAYICEGCGNEIPLGTHVYVPEGQKVMTERDAVRILWGDFGRASGQWRSGSDIAESLASFFEIDQAKAEKYLSELRDARAQ